MKYIVIICICLSGFNISGQIDTSYLEYDQLHWTDVDLSVTGELATKVLAGTRSERNLEDLPFTVFVITAQEIKEQGYVTLTDAIKHLPGIRISKSGSGLDGESFLMRGLYGNSYAKILINDIPIKPSVVGAMPLGGQLPIQQAERIEVIYGPAATLYGTDAASGVINIILKESEYPTYAQASISTGDNDLIQLSALFGGKVGLAKKILKLQVYGGFYSFSDRRVKYDLDSLYNPEVYDRLFNNLDLVSYENRPNYIGEAGTPVISNLPHQSSYLGFSASYGAFQFNTQRLFRADHSSLGLSPFAVSYADPRNLIGEEILTSTISFRRQFSKWDFKIQAGVLDYALNPLSSYRYILPTFGVVTNLYFQRNIEPTSMVNGPRTIDSLYLSGQRYIKSKTSDASLDAQFNFTVNDNFSLSTGFQSIAGFGDAIERFRRFPGVTEDRFIQLPVLKSPREVSISELSAFVEAYLNVGSFQAIAGAQIFLRGDSLVINDPEFNPRLGILYRPTSKFSLRASFSSAFRYPASFFSGSTYQMYPKDDFIEVVTGSPELEPERTISFETGFRLKPSPTIYIDGSIYYTRTTNYINYDIGRGQQPGSLLWGYRNDPNSFNRLFGGQLSMYFKNLWPAMKFNTEINLNYSKGKERVLQNFIENFEQNELRDLPVIRAQPDFMGHIRMSFEPQKRIKFFLNHSFMTKSWTRNKYRITLALENNETERLQNNGYYTLDIKTLFKISRQLNGYLNISNVFNTQYAGIDASFEPDVLLFNPQPLRTYRIGINFAFN